jgi:hypothetical protein
MPNPSDVETSPPRHVVAAWAEHASGPGWSNRLVNVLYRDGNGMLTIERLQPDQQTADMSTLFDVSATVTLSMIAAVPMEKRRGR